MKEALMTLDDMFTVLDTKQRQLEELQAEVDELHLNMTKHLLVNHDKSAVRQLVGMLPQNSPYRAVLRQSTQQQNKGA
jgi:hypothetical protein